MGQQGPSDSAARLSNRSDLSDVCEKLALLRRSPGAALNISKNARSFFVTHLDPQQKDYYIVEILRQWGELYQKFVEA